MSARDLVDEAIAAGALEWVPCDWGERNAPPTLWECIACGVRFDARAIVYGPAADGSRCAICPACNAHHLAPDPLDAARLAARDAVEAPAPRPGALLDALCAMLQAFPEARNHDQERARRAGLGALDLLAGFAQPAHVVELARAVARLDECRQARDCGRGDSDALSDAHAWVMVAARRLVGGVL